jgi:hypothetical protein
MTGAIVLLLIVASMFWVGFDAKRRDWSQKKHGAKTASGQIIGVVIFWIVFFPVYLYQRRNVPLITPNIGPGSPSISVTQAPTTKTCPECAETIQLAARLCKHCGHRFDVETPTGAA